MSTSNEIHSILKCAFCKTMHCAVYACPSAGKLICEKCVHEQGCSISDVLKIPALETIIKLQKFPCKLQKNGCKEQLPVDSLLEHEVRCIYRPCTCMVKNCQWNGLQVDLHKHFHNIHSKNVGFGAIRLPAFKTESIENVVLTLVNGAVFIIEYKYNPGTDVAYKISYVSPYIMNANYEFYEELDQTDTVSLLKGECLTLDRSVFKSLTYYFGNSTIILEIKSTRYEDYIIDRTLINGNNCSKCNGYLIPSGLDPESTVYVCSSCIDKSDTCVPASQVSSNYITHANIPCRWKFCYYVGKPMEMYLHENECRFYLHLCVYNNAIPRHNHSKDLSDMEKHLINDCKMENFVNQFFVRRLYRNKFTIFTITERNAIVVIEIQAFLSTSFSVKVQVTGSCNIIPVYIQCEHKHCNLKSRLFRVVDVLTIEQQSLPSCFKIWSDISLTIRLS